MSDPERSLAELAAAGEYVALEERWLELCDLSPSDLRPFVEAARTLVGRDEAKRASVLLSFVVPMCETCADAQAGVEVLSIASDCEPSDLGLRRQLIAAITRCHSDAVGLKAFIDAAEIQTHPKPSEAVAKMRRLLDVFGVGRHVYHLAAWGAGRIQRISAATGKITVDFERNPGHVMPLSGAVSLLEPLDDGDFRAMCFSGLDDVKQMAQDDPVALMELLLKSVGGKATMRQVKLRLVDGVIPNKDWTKWWTSARRALRHAPMVAMTAGSAPTFTLREQAVSPYQALGERYHATKDMASRFAIARDSLKQLDHSEEATEVMAAMASDLWTRAKGLIHREPSRAIELLMLVDKLRRRIGEEDMPEGTAPRDIISGSEDVVSLLHNMSFDDLRREGMELAREIWPQEWPNVWAWMLLVPSPSTCDMVVRELERTGNLDMLQSALAYVIENAMEYPESVMWLWRRVTGDRLPVAFDVAARVGLFERMLRLLNEAAGQEGEGRDSGLIGKLRGCLSSDNYDAVEKLAESVPKPEASRLHDLVSFNRGMSDDNKRAILQIFEAAAPEELTELTKPWEEDVIYTTEEGLQRQREELERLVTVEYRKVTVAIGEAAEQGDISDNAEYQAAIEARGQLTQRATKLRADIDLAKVIAPHMVPEDEVAIGSRVRVKALDTNASHTFVILGPWDADPEADRLSYKAPFCLAFLGHRKGHTVELDMAGTVERYEILGTECAI